MYDLQGEPTFAEVSVDEAGRGEQITNHKSQIPNSKEVGSWKMEAGSWKLDVLSLRVFFSEVRTKKCIEKTMNNI
jgi:hypothetical protein